jgi:hypothetical protein
MEPEHHTSNIELRPSFICAEAAEPGGYQLLAKGDNTRKLLDFKNEFIPIKTILKPHMGVVT